MVGLLVVLLVLGFALVMNGVQQLVNDTEAQNELVDQQRDALARQNEVIDRQRDQLVEQRDALAEQLQALAIQEQTSVAMQIYPEFLFWRLASTSSLSERDVEEGDRAEQRLRTAVQDLSALDEELAEAIDVFLLDLNDFNGNIAEAIDAFNQGDTNYGQQTVQRSQNNFLSMNTMMEVVSMLATEAVVDANEGVTESLEGLSIGLNNVEAAADQVSTRGDALIAGIGRVIASGQTTQTQGWATMAVVSVLFLVVGYLLSHSVSKPVLKLQQTIKRIDETADLSEQVDLQRHDEVGQIADSFNSMLHSFAAIVRDVRDSAAIMAEKVNDNSSANEEVGRILDQLNTEVDQVATAINELSATVRGINGHTSEAATSALAAEDRCRESSQQSERSGQQVAVLEGEIRTASERLNHLAERTNEINAVVDVIQGVSEQTNLLALNAAIEAARAGEQGRGFAVVADEVRSLAQKTEQSSDEIKVMVEQFSNEVSVTVKAMQKAVDAAGSAGALSKEASTSMQAVLATVSEIRSTNEHISEATQEQTEATESIDGSVTNIATLIAQVAEQAQQTVDGVHQMADLASRLSDQAGRFKLAPDQK